MLLFDVVRQKLSAYFAISFPLRFGRVKEAAAAGNPTKEALVKVAKK